MSDGNGEDKVLGADVCKLVPSVVENVDIAKVAKSVPLGKYTAFDEHGRLSVEAAEDEPEVRLLRLECAMGQMLQLVMPIKQVLPAVCRKIKALEVAVGGLENVIRQLVKKRF